jgi:hypothetical protein
MSGSLPSLTDFGLPGIRHVPYGVHFCNFYRSREELVAALVPYFRAGLQARERCLWITAEPLPAVQAIAELRAAGIDAEAEIRRGALVVRDYSDWYAEAEALKGADVVDLWLAEEQRALADGYAGLRITGNVTFLKPGEWDLFMEYEALVSEALRTRRIVTLCTYDFRCCSASEVFDVMRRHDCAIDRPDQGWRILNAHPG